MKASSPLLSTLLEDYRCVECDLVRAMTRRASDRTRAELLRRSAALLDAIERFEARSRQDLRDQAFFFLQRAVSAGGGRDGADLEIALSLSARAIEAERTLPGLPLSAPSAPPPDLAAYVRASKDRVSLVGFDHRYLATSAPNAQFYRRSVERVEGCAVGDLIGRARFDSRARPNIDTCLAGRPREYYHGLGTGARARIMRCQMKPVRLADDRPAALIYMRDVTDDLPAMLRAGEV